MTTKDFEERIGELLKSFDFKKRKYSFITQIDENIFGIIGFGSVSHQIKGTLFVHPTVGIYNKAVDDLFRQLMGINGKSYFQPIINTSIGYLTPDNDYKEWMVTDDNIDLINSELIDIIKMYGLPFIEKYQNTAELLKCVEDRKYILSENRDYDLPILYYLNGDKQKGLNYLEGCLERKKNQLNSNKINKSTPFFSKATIDSTFLKYYENYKLLM